MKQRFFIVFSFFYLFGTFCLPQSDFSTLVDFPEMYRNCKATEDKDMNLVDFVTDHLINIDGFFDQHLKGDEQKPHSPKHIHHYLSQTCFIQTNEVFKPLNLYSEFFNLKKSNYSANFYTSDYSKSLLRPPIV